MHAEHPDSDALNAHPPVKDESRLDYHPPTLPHVPGDTPFDANDAEPPAANDKLKRENSYPDISAGVSPCPPDTGGCSSYTDPSLETPPSEIAATSGDVAIPMHYLGSLTDTDAERRRAYLKNIIPGSKKKHSYALNVPPSSAMRISLDRIPFSTKGQRIFENAHSFLGPYRLRTRCTPQRLDMRQFGDFPIGLIICGGEWMDTRPDGHQYCVSPRTRL